MPGEVGVHLARQVHHHLFARLSIGFLRGRRPSLRRARRPGFLVSFVTSYCSLVLPLMTLDVDAADVLIALVKLYDAGISSVFHVPTISNFLMHMYIRKCIYGIRMPEAGAIPYYYLMVTFEYKRDD